MPFDAHFHLDFCKSPQDHADAAERAGLGMLAVSCEPAGYQRVLGLAGTGRAGVVPALGLHPWWVARGQLPGDALPEFERLAPGAAAFGELGLDFDDRHTPPESHAAQIAALERALRAADASSRASGARKPLSLHALRATGTVLDVLARTGCLESCTCVFHWFSDSQPELSRAIAAGCWFSVNERALRSKRWGEYAKLVPEDRLLLETDLPGSPGTPIATVEHAASLERAAKLLAGILALDMRAQLDHNARELLARCR